MRSARNWLPFCAISLFTSFLHATHSDVSDHWDVLTEFVYLKRSKVTSRKLAKNYEYPYCDHGCPSTVAISAKDLVNEFGFEPGFRVGMSYIPDTKSLYQTRFMYVWPWSSEKSTSGDGSVSYPFHNTYFTEDYNVADKATATYNSKFYTFDLNYWRNSATRGQDYFVMSGVFGIRYFHLQESSTLVYKNDYLEGVSYGNYDTNARNDTIGIQGGFDLQVNPYMGFRFDLMALAGLGLNRPYASVLLLDQNDTVIVRDYNKQHSQSVVFADVEAQIGYQIVSCFNMHAGYQMFYASGLAFSVAQYSTSTKQSSERYYKNGYFIIHGIFVGFDFRF